MVSSDASLARAGVVQEQQHCVVATALLGAPVRAGQQRVDLRLVEVRHGCVSSLLVRDTADLCTPCNMLRAVLPDEARQSMDGGKALIARGDAAAARGLDVTEELPHQLRRHIDHRQSIHCLVQPRRAAPCHAADRDPDRAGVPVLVIGNAEAWSIDWSVLLSTTFDAISAFPLLAIPLFILGGELMNHGGLIRQLAAVCDRLMGWAKAPMGHVL